KVGNELFVIRWRIDASAGVRDDADADRPAVSESAKLFEFLQLFQWVRREGGKLEQRVAAIGIKPEVMQVNRRPASEVGPAIADMRDRAAAEIKRSAALVAN